MSSFRIWKGERGEEERPGEERARKRERGDGRGERRASTLPKIWKGCVRQVVSEQEEREGTKREERQEGRGQVESERRVTDEARSHGREARKRGREARRGDERGREETVRCTKRDWKNPFT